MPAKVSPSMPEPVSTAVGAAGPGCRTLIPPVFSEK
jgi:hypothetical protein